MTNIYDVLLNFTDEEKIPEFFEWDNNDILDHVKKIPLIRISKNKLNDFINYNLVVEESFLEQIKNKTYAYKKESNLEYATLLSDINKVIAVEFDKKGNIISRSSLLLDEEEDILAEVMDLEEENISYKIKNKYNINYFLTRQEQKRKNYLLKEITNLYKENNIDKLTFLYEELYKKDNLSFEEMYKKLKQDITKDYSKKHNLLYDIVRLTYIKK